MKVKLKNGFTEVKVIIKHPMQPESNKAGNITESHYIEDITCEHNGEIIMEANWGTGISADPFFAFEFEGGKVGDLVKVIWQDNR